MKMNDITMKMYGGHTSLSPNCHAKPVKYHYVLKVNFSATVTSKDGPWDVVQIFSHKIELAVANYFNQKNLRE